MMEGMQRPVDIYLSLPDLAAIANEYCNVVPNPPLFLALMAFVGIQGSTTQLCCC